MVETICSPLSVPKHFCILRSMKRALERCRFHLNSEVQEISWSLCIIGFISRLQNSAEKGVAWWLTVIYASVLKVTLCDWDKYNSINHPCADYFWILKSIFPQIHITSVNECVWIWICIASFEAFVAVILQVEVFWVVMQCSAVVGYQCFTGPCWRWKQPGSLKHWYSTTALHSVTTQKTLTWIYIVQERMYQILLQVLWSDWQADESSVLSYIRGFICVSVTLLLMKIEVTEYKHTFLSFILPTFLPWRHQWAKCSLLCHVCFFWCLSAWNKMWYITVGSHECKKSVEWSCYVSDVWSGLVFLNLFHMLINYSIVHYLMAHWITV